MDLEFELAVEKYYGIVQSICESLLEIIRSREDVLVYDKSDLYVYLRSHNVHEYVTGNEKYIFHGAGCSYYISEVLMAEWDFGYRNLWCGIDPYKMSRTLRNYEYYNNEYYNAEYIKSMCDRYVAEERLRLYKCQYYIDLLKKDTVRISFPSEYDKLIIKDGVKTYVIQKSSIVDKFIRRSNKVYKCIDELSGNMSLEFYYKDQLVASILYNDVAYPDSAVDLMTHQILKKYKA